MSVITIDHEEIVSYRVGVSLAIRVIETWRTDLLRRGSEPIRQPAPAQCLDVGEERRVRSQRGELLEELCQLQTIVQDVRGELIDRAITCNQPCSRLGSDFRDSGIPVRDGQIRLWEVSTGRARAVIGLVSEVLQGWMERVNLELLGGGRWSPHCIRDVFRATSFSPDGKTLASAGIDGVVRIWDVATGKLLASYSGHKDLQCGL